jgi:Na+-transporting NADH:ubiquinone oxidoreductase subunit NqrE
MLCVALVFLEIANMIGVIQVHVHIKENILHHYQNEVTYDVLYTYGVVS